MNLLEVSGLTVEFPVPGGILRAVEDMELTVRENEIVCLVGESGCGKSVTVRSLFGLLPPPGRRTAGKIIFNGQDVDSLSPKELRALCGKEVGYVFQDPMTYLNPVMAIGAQLAEAFSGSTKFANDAVLTKEMEELLGGLGIGEPRRVLRSYPHQLSGGMRQRILIGMAVARKPRLLILDEPTTALDVSIQAQIMELIHAIQKHSRCGLIFVTHDFGIVSELADSVFVMYAGQLIENGSKAEIFNSPKHPYTKGLMECVIPLASEKGLRTIKGEVPNLKSPPPGCRFAARCPGADQNCVDSMPPITLKDTDSRVRCHHWRDDAISPAAEIEDGKLSASMNNAVRDDTDRKHVEILSAEKAYPVRGGAFGGASCVHALNGVSSAIQKGEIFALVGESGCGKSTLGRMIAGLEPLTSGTVSVAGKDPERHLRQSKDRPLVQMVFQDPYSSLNPRKTIRHALAQPLINYSLCSSSEVEIRILHYLELMGLTPAADFLDRYPHELSGGQRQRVVLARALLAEPEVLVADEPVSSLDMSTRAQILGLLQKLRTEMGLAILLITHDLAVVSSVAERMGVMYLGRLCESAPSREGIASPLHPYTQMLVSAVPQPRPDLSQSRPGNIMKGDPPSPVHLPSGCFLHERCPYARSVCSRVSPELKELAPGHFAACHLYGGTEGKGDTP